MALIKVKDSITPAVKHTLAMIKDKKPLLSAMGEAIVTMGVQAFTDPAKRSAAWAPRKDKLPHPLLQKKTMLRKSIRVIRVDEKQVVVGSDRPYAAIHQMGGTIKHRARQQVLHFSKDKPSGQKKFSKKKKADHAQKVERGAHSTTIPARPYLPFRSDGSITETGHNRTMAALQAALKVRGI